MSINEPSRQRHDRPILQIQPAPVFLQCCKVDVPVRRETLLMIELEAQEFCVDLKALSQLVLNDLGATLHVFRLVGQEYGDVAGRPCRIEDCIAAMGVETCIRAMSVQTLQKTQASEAMTTLSSHSRSIALHCRKIAGQLADVDLDQAYLVGLCHSLGSLPAIFGWRGSKTTTADAISNGFRMAKDWTLPKCVVEYFCDLKTGGPSPWVEMVRAAHLLAGNLEGRDCGEADLPPQLRWAV